LDSSIARRLNSSVLSIVCGAVKLRIGNLKSNSKSSASLILTGTSKFLSL